MSHSTESSPSNVTPNLRLLLLLAGVCFTLLVILMIASGSKPAVASSEKSALLKQQAKVTVSNIRIQEGFDKPRTVFGQLESAQQSNIGFELSGMLAKVSVVEGATVEQGQVLATLDTARLTAQQNELLSALKSADANAKLARLSEKRVKELVSKKLEPQQRLDEVQAQLDAANAAVSEMRARLDSVEVELSKSRLIAPFNGQVVTQFIDEGTVLNAGQAVFSILQNNGLEARFGLPEQTAFGVSLEQHFDVQVGGLVVPATVKSVAKQRDLATRTIEAVLLIDLQTLSVQQQSMLVSGDLVSLQVNIPVQKRGAWVPNSALASGIRGMWTLYVINQNNTVETRIVSIEYANNEQAFVSGAIKDNDTFVVDGIHRLTPHQQVSRLVHVNTAELAAR